MDLEPGALRTFFRSLLRLTRLEELHLGAFPWFGDWALGGSLPRLRRLECSGRLPRHLAVVAPNLEVLIGDCRLRGLDQLPSGLSELRFADFWSGIDMPLLRLTRLTGLRDLGLPRDIDFTELPELLAALTILTRLEIRAQVEDGDLPQLMEALRRAPVGLGLFVHSIYLGSSSPAVEQLFGHLVEGTSIVLRDPTSAPWAALTRATRLMKGLEANKDSASYIQTLPQLPSLRDLSLRLQNRVPTGIGSLIQCTNLNMMDAKRTASLSCIQQLVRLKQCTCTRPQMSFLPSSITRLSVFGPKPAFLPFGTTARHLTALESLELGWPTGDNRVCDLSPLSRLTTLTLIRPHCHQVHLGMLPCLRGVHLSEPEGLDAGMLEQLDRLPSLRRLVTKLHGENVCGFENSYTWRAQEIGQVLLPASCDPASATITVKISGVLSGDCFPSYEHYGNVQLTDGTNTAVLDTSAPGNNRASFENAPNSYMSSSFVSAAAAPSPGAFNPGAPLKVAVHQYREWWPVIYVHIQVSW